MLVLSEGEKVKRIGGVILCLVAVLAAAAILSTHPRAKLVMSKWAYQHLVSTDEKVRRLNEESAWGKGELMLSYPGGCALVPYSDDLVVIEHVDPLRFAIVDQASGERRPVNQVDACTFSFVCKEYPIEITFVVTEASAQGCKVEVRARKTH